jgi:hypothetical protein
MDEDTIEKATVIHEECVDLPENSSSHHHHDAMPPTCGMYIYRYLDISVYKR